MEIWILLIGFAFGKNAITQGDSAVVRSPNTLTIENSQSVKAIELSGNRFQLQTKKPGVVRYKTKSDIQELQVLSWTQTQTYKWFSQIMPATLNLRLNIENAQVRLIGKLLRVSDLNRFKDLCLRKTCDYQFAAQLSSELFKQIQKDINQELARRNLPAVVLQNTKNLRTQVAMDEENLSDIKEVLSAYGVEVKTAKNSVKVKPLVRVTVTLAEIKKTASLSIGLAPPSSVSAKIIPSFDGNLTADEFTLRFLENNGNARVLANPKLLIRSGEQAEFLAGGEFPIKVVNFRAQDVIWKKYGLILKLKPLADFSGKLNLSIETEVSQIDPSRTVDGVPGLFTNRVKSHFDLLKNQLVALSGLINLQSAQATQGLPTLQKLPILGSLFSSKDFLQNRTELLVLVYPEVIHPSDSSLVKVL